MANFVSVPESSFDSAFAGKGFKKFAVNNETVYEIAVAGSPGLRVRVYSSLTTSGACREAGADAIRACLVFVGKDRTYGMGKGIRVNRVGTVAGIMERTLERARDMYREGLKSAARGTCSCGSARWADSGRCVAKCWTKFRNAGSSYRSGAADAVARSGGKSTMTDDQWEQYCDNKAAAKFEQDAYGND